MEPDDFCHGCSRDLPNEMDRVIVREDDTGEVMTLGAQCCLGFEEGYTVL
jgi:hypothetical protein